MRSIKWCHFQWPWTNPNHLVRLHDYTVSSGRLPGSYSLYPAVRQSLQPCMTHFIGWIFHNESRINWLCWCTSVYMIWHQNIWRERVFSCPLYLVDHTSVPLKTTNFLYRDRSLLPRALGRSVHPVLPRGTLFQLGYSTHHWHSNSSSVCSRRHCLRDCQRTRLSDSSLLFVRFEVSVYYYYYY